MNNATLLAVVLSLGVSMLGASLLLLILRRASNRPQRTDGVQGLHQEPGNVGPAYPTVAPTPPSGRALGFSVAVLLWMVIAVAIGSIWQAIEVHQVHQLQAEGIRVTGRVSDKKSSSGEDGETYYIHYTFSATTDVGLRDYTRRESVPKSFYDRTAKDAPIEVVYVASDPDISRLLDFYTPGEMHYLGVFLGAGLFMPGAVLAARQFRRYRNARRLDDEGIPATTQVVEHATHKGSEGNEYYIIYELPGVGLVQQSVTRGQQTWWFTPGTPIRLLYHPDNPRVFRMKETLNG